MKNTIIGLKSLENLIINYRPSNNEINYQFNNIIETIQDREIVQAIVRLATHILNNNISNNEISYQFNSLKQLLESKGA
jgi:replication initiation and membrane attachment protein DnaB